MTDLILIAKTRNLFGKKNKYLRRQNKVPAVIYGHGLKSQSIEIDNLLFKKIYESAGESTLVDLKVNDQKPVKVLIQEVQLDPLTEQYLHVDFHQVKMTEKMAAEVPLKFIGEAPIVKEQGGILVKNLDKIKIECLPNDLIHEVAVDISGLKNFEDTIHVQDLNIPKGIDVLDKPEETVVLVEKPRTEEELKALEEKVEPAVPAEEKIGEVAVEAPEEGEAVAKKEKKEISSSEDKS